MTDKSEKKFCSKCGDRVSHSARRCPYCGQRIFTARLVLTYIIIAVMIVTAIFLVRVYLNK
jgi:RNA polymerase subunit RPABC4/transcription elongation factor Spt4